ncbi:anaerobic ribonucleoside-triphosphate reductase activating protein [Megamonas funiformis]|uniref:anaerobic ribonucleoside-triphosphate reductase activating protein n=1 Tax=Megamonas funiformis TaxID=437897 RepID=UPI003F856B04
MANIAKIKKYCISNGEGLRTAIFFSGCDFHCKGCFNYKLQNPNYGEEYTETKEQEIFNSINEHISGISILGGEPLSQYNLNTVTKLCVNFKENFPDKTIWLWTGYTLEDIKELSILKYIDVLIDGQFKQDEYEYGLPWRGSRNQRILKKGIDF